MTLRHSVVLIALYALAACTNEKIVYVTQPPFNPPADSINGFLGYFTASTKQTTCGNCHVLHQRDWSGTVHSHAWSDLVASGHQAANGSCDACHSVSSYGNMAAAPAGYKKVADSAYHDVQCESCHGPGFEHVSFPDAVGSAPLANVFVDTAANGPGTCAACHSGTHTPYWEEWKQSLHSAMGRHSTEELCQRCHTGQGALESWGVTAAYIGSNNPIGANAFGITCAVCHDPHGTAKDPVTGQINEGQLRFPLASSDPAKQLCMKCHYRRTEPLAMDSTRVESPGGTNSPHAPQGATVIGELGYQNPSYLDPVLIDVAKTASHGNLTKNPKLCAGCHVHPFSSTDPASGQTVFATGHLFRPIPCYGPDGVTPTDSIKNCAYSPVERSFKACVGSGCHASENEPAGLLAVARGRIQDLTTTLWVNSNTASSGIDTLDSGILPAILKNTWSQKGTLNNLTLFANGAVAQGDSVINLDATSLTGKLAVGNTLQIGTSQYTVTATVTAAANQLNGVHVTPPLAAAVADNTKILVMKMGDLLQGDRVITAADGAEFNVRAVGEDASGNFVAGTSVSGGDRSHTVHNPFLAEALLRANIDELTALYGSQPWFPSIPASVQRILSGPLGATGSVPFPRPASRAGQRVSLQ
jgi:cytochrome c554/c'-like protein